MPAPTPVDVTLSNLKYGERAVITRIDTGDPVFTAKYAARGIVPGTNIGILRAGDPVLIGIDNDRWAINGPDAARIHVDRLAEPRRSLFAFLFGR